MKILTRIFPVMLFCMGNTAGDCGPDTPGGGGGQPASCPIEFAVTQHCASVEWTAGPSISTNNAYTLRVWKKGGSPTGPFEAPGAILTVAPWMPSMGHGTTPTTVTTQAPGVYAISRINFAMGGDWQLQHHVKNASGATIETSSYDLSVR